ncbi:WD40-repeat-containing domain protein [Obelidium mucronatum]|nr:WD40-repeat-containing domain protein [Obelidium mucronatum]
MPSLLTSESIREPKFTNYTSPLPLTKVRFSPEANVARGLQVFAVGNSSGGIGIWNATNGGLAGQLWTCSNVSYTAVGAAPVAALSFSSVVVAGVGRAVVCLNPATLVRATVCVGGPVVAVAASKQRAAAALADGGVASVDVATATAEHTTAARVDAAAPTALQWRGTHEVVVATDAGRLVVVDLRAAAPALHLQDLRNPDVGINCVAVHPSSHTTIATGCEDGSVKVWDLRSAAKEPEVQVFEVHSSDGRLRALE